MRVSMLTFIMFFMWMQGDVSSVRIVELRVAAHMAEGRDALLSCRYDLGRDSLYSLKWYKDGKEFFRYEPKARTPMKSYSLPGAIVDLNRSSVDVVTLKHLTINSTGVYRCEVYGEGPNFTMASREKHVTIDLLPKSGPQIHGLQEDYRIGSYLDVNCTTSPSRPEAQLTWFINESPVPRSYLQGPFLVISTNKPFMYQAKLRLNFTVEPSNFDDQGALNIKVLCVPDRAHNTGLKLFEHCQATIPPLYLQETNFTLHEPTLRTTLPLLTTESNTGHIASREVIIILLILQVLLVLIVN